MKHRIRVQGQLIILAVIGTLILSRLIVQTWVSEGAEEVLDILGMGIIFLGYIFRVAARGYKSESLSGGKILVKGGPYTVTRNPMYLGTALIGSGVILMLFNILGFLIFLSAAALIYIPQVRKEQVMLLEKYGSEYELYCKNVPLFFPTVKSLMLVPTHFKIKASWIKKEIVSIVLVILVVSAFEVWLDTKLFGLNELIEEVLELSGMVFAFSLLSLFIFFKAETPAS